MPKEYEDVEDIYSENYIETLEESDEIDEAEEGFMQGYNEGKLATECMRCRKVLDSNFIEEKISNETYRFCSGRCAGKYLKES